MLSSNLHIVFIGSFMDYRVVHRWSVHACLLLCQVLSFQTHIRAAMQEVNAILSCLYACSFVRLFTYYIPCGLIGDIFLDELNSPLLNVVTTRKSTELFKKCLILLIQTMFVTLYSRVCNDFRPVDLRAVHIMSTLILILIIALCLVHVIQYFMTSVYIAQHLMTHYEILNLIHEHVLKLKHISKLMIRTTHLLLVH